MTMHDPEHDIERLIGAAGPRNVPDAERTARVRPAVERAWRQEVARRRRHRRTLAGVTALMVAAVLLFVVFRPTPTIEEPKIASQAPLAAVEAVSGRVLLTGSGMPEVQTGARLIAGTRLETSRSATATLSFIDGVELRIHEHTALRIDGLRTIALEHGTIYLDSGESAAGGYTVTAPAGVLRDIGTRFEVQSSDNAFRLRVRDGAVLLERAGKTDRANGGDELAVSADGRVTMRKVRPFGPDWDWTTLAAPVFNVEDATLEAFLVWAVREGGWLLEEPDAAFRELARSTKIHGDIAGLTPEEALAVVLPTCGLTATFRDGRVFIRRVSGEGGLQ